MSKHLNAIHIANGIDSIGRLKGICINGYTLSPASNTCCFEI